MPTAKREAWTIDGREVVVSSLAKPYWPEDAITKGDLLAYYRSVAPTMLPYLVGRPVTAVVLPRGVGGFSYYRRDRPKNAPEWIPGVPYRRKTDAKPVTLLTIEDEAGLIWLVNQGAIEIHPWMARLPDVEHPDQVVFDCDPGEGADFGDVLAVARIVRAALDEQGLRSYPKTTGGSGLHIVIPVDPVAGYETVRDWVEALADRLAAEHPDRISSAGGATHRGHRVTLDYAQNSVGKNLAAPYTVRARPQAPVSTPLAWEEVEEDRVRPGDFTIRTVPDRLVRLGDLFAPVLRGGQRLP
jgi:bifunctional non-homologous end joining protein LigD